MPVMSRSFVAVCVAVLAACLSAVLYGRFGLSLVEALLVGANIFIVSLIVQEALSVRALMSTIWERVEATRAAFGPIEAQLARMGQQIAALSQPKPSRPDQTAEDVATLGSMVKELADSIASLEGRVAQQALALRQAPGIARATSETSRPPVQEPRPPEPRAQPKEFAPPPPTPLARQPEPPIFEPALGAPLDLYTAQPKAAAPISAAAAPPPPSQQPLSQPPTPAEKPRDMASQAPQNFETIVGDIVDAISGDRLETFLQPVVTLPQRKVRSYEVLARLRMRDGAMMLPEEFVTTAESLGIAPVMDLRQFVRTAQIVRKLSAKNRDIQVMVNISPKSLTATTFITACVDSVRQSPSLASQIILEMDQAAVRTLGMPELAGLKTLTEAGFRLSMDQIADLRLDGPTLFERGFRFVKIPAALLLDPLSQRGTEVLTTDMGNLLRRHGVELIADLIETEATVRDLLDYDIALAQGHLFAAPRPVRADVLTDDAPAAAATPPRTVPPKIVPPEQKRATGVVASPTDAAPADVTAMANDAASTSKAAWRTLARRVSRTES
jgi:cyclic-di-GMP phosphodiesterase TipF (flagellum assembly factor)